MKLAEAIAVMNAAHNTSTILPEAMVMTLKEVATRYAAPCPFKPGDLVTPREGANLKNVGQPCIVLEVFAEPVRNFVTSDPNEVTSDNYGMRFDMRTAGFFGETVVAHMAESWRYELYITEDETTA